MWGTLRMWGRWEGALRFPSWGTPWDGRREHRRGGFRLELLMGGPWTDVSDVCVYAVSFLLPENSFSPGIMKSILVIIC